MHHILNHQFTNRNYFVKATNWILKSSLLALVLSSTTTKWNEKRALNQVDAFTTPILNITEEDSAKTGNGPVPNWVNTPERREFFDKVHNVHVTNEEVLGLRNKWLEQGYEIFGVLVAFWGWGQFCFYKAKAFIPI